MNEPRLGLIALRGGQPKDALDCFQRSLSVEPADPVCLNNLGNVLKKALSDRAVRWNSAGQ